MRSYYCIQWFWTKIQLISIVIFLGKFKVTLNATFVMKICISGISLFSFLSKWIVKIRSVPWWCHISTYEFRKAKPSKILQCKAILLNKHQMKNFRAFRRMCGALSHGQRRQNRCAYHQHVYTFASWQHFASPIISLCWTACQEKGAWTAKKWLVAPRRTTKCTNYYEQIDCQWLNLPHNDIYYVFVD